MIWPEFPCDATGFGWIEIAGERYERDALIRLDGTIKQRKKQLSKRIYGDTTRGAQSAWRRPTQPGTPSRRCDRAQWRLPL